MSMIVNLQSEVTDINKQKFLAELGKLLTFMYEEDKQAALSMYNKMLDDATDEQSLLQMLVSPTRQAVVIARAYNSKERRLQVHSQSKENIGTEELGIPDFVQAIDKVRSDAETRGLLDAVPVVPAEQFSLFEDAVFTYAEPADPDEAYSEGLGEEKPAVEEVEAEEVQLHEAELEEAQPQEAEEKNADEFISCEEPVEAEAEEGASQEDAVVDEFLAEFSVENADIPEEETGSEEETVAEPQDGIVVLEEEAPVVPQDPAAPVRKPKILLLILYVLLAIPLTAVGIVILLIPTLLTLALAVTAISVGVAVLVGAFSGFVVLADILLLLGAALIILALGLLFLWIFVWFIGGAIVSLIHGVIVLGGKWCYKEVPAV